MSITDGIRRVQGTFCLHAFIIQMNKLGTVITSISLKFVSY